MSKMRELDIKVRNRDPLTNTEKKLVNAMRLAERRCLTIREEPYRHPVTMLYPQPSRTTLFGRLMRAIFG